MSQRVLANGASSKFVFQISRTISPIINYRTDLESMTDNELNAKILGGAKSPNLKDGLSTRVIKECFVYSKITEVKA